jgi:hypothetical protein
MISSTPGVIMDHNCIFNFCEGMPDRLRAVRAHLTQDNQSLAADFEK